MSGKLNRLLFGDGSGDARVAPENVHVAVVTSALDDPFNVIDSIIAVSSQRAGAGSVDLEGIFEHVKNKLRRKCIDLGGDCVINCRFSERGAHSGGIAASQVIEVWAYGTVVKLRTQNAKD